MKTIVIDAADSILGRIASVAAKQALLGNEVAVINCEKAVISGRKAFAVSSYKQLRAKGGSSLKGPIFPTQPAPLVKRTIRGMLSHKEGRGAAALKRIKCFEGIPKEYAESKFQKIPKAEGIQTTSIKEISEELR